METKRLEDHWSDKTSPTYPDLLTLSTQLHNVNIAFQNADEALSAAGERGISYSSQFDQINDIVNDLSALETYVTALPYQIDEKLDTPFHKAFANEATETLSRVRLSEFVTDNTLGIHAVGTIPDGYSYESYEYIYLKSNLGFEDFLGVNKNREYSVEGNFFVKEFSDLFEEQYESLKNFLEDKELTEKEYLEFLMTQGEFDHRMAKPVLQFFSDLLDITIVKPIIEMATGEDLLTGEDLSDFERGLEGVTALLNLITLGQAVWVTRLAGGGAKTILVSLGKTIVIEIATDAAAMGTAKLATELGLPDSVSFLLAMGAGVAVTSVGGKWLFTSSDGSKVLGEVAQSPEMDAAIKQLDEAGTGMKLVDDAADVGSESVFDINKIRPQLKTEPDTAFFWSGRTDGVDGANAAADIAKDRGGVTLESTIDTLRVA